MSCGDNVTLRGTRDVVWKGVEEGFSCTLSPLLRSLPPCQSYGTLDITDTAVLQHSCHRIMVENTASVSQEAREHEWTNISLFGSHFQCINQLSDSYFSVV